MTARESDRAPEGALSGSTSRGGLDGNQPSEAKVARRPKCKWLERDETGRPRCEHGWAHKTGTGFRCREIKKEWQEKNREHVKEYERARRKRDRPSRLEYFRRYHAANREKRLEVSRLYYQENKEHVASRMALYRLTYLPPVRTRY